MKKTKYIILILALCFSLAFVAFLSRISYGSTYNLPPNGAGGETGYLAPTTPKPTSGGTTGGGGDLTYGGSWDVSGSLGGGIPVIGGPQTWMVDTTGQSNTFFAADPSLGGFIYTVSPTTAVAPSGGNGGNGSDKYSCNTSTWTCSKKSNGTYSSLAICQSNCKKPPTITPTIEPSQAKYRCRQCRGTTCSVRYSNTPCADTCRTNNDCRGGTPPHPVTPPSVSPPPTLPGTYIFNQPPSAINLSVSQPDYCSVSWVVAIFSWKFFDPDGDSQFAYQIQVDNNSNFSSPEVDTGKIQSSSNSYATLPGKLSWNTTYYWRLKVWDSKDLSSSWISGPSFTTPKHAYPSIDFSWNPQNPATNEIVQFTDRSTVFGGATKQSWLWTFQDGSPANSSVQNATTTFTSTDSKNVSLRVRDSSNFECTGSRSVNIRLPLPEYKEVPPIIWLKKFFAGIINFFDGFLKI